MFFVFQHASHLWGSTSNLSWATPSVASKLSSSISGLCIPVSTKRSRGWCWSFVGISLCLMYDVLFGSTAPMEGASAVSRSQPGLSGTTWDFHQFPQSQRDSGSWKFGFWNDMARAFAAMRLCIAGNSRLGVLVLPLHGLILKHKDCWICRQRFVGRWAQPNSSHWYVGEAQGSS